MSTMRNIETAIGEALGTPGIGRWRLALSDLINPDSPGYRDVATLLFASMAAHEPDQAAAAVAQAAQAKIQNIRAFHADEHWPVDPDHGFDLVPATPLDAITAALTLAAPINRMAVEIGGKAAVVMSPLAGFDPPIMALATYAVDGYEPAGAPSVREIHDFTQLASQLHDILATAPLQPVAPTV